MAHPNRTIQCSWNNHVVAFVVASKLEIAIFVDAHSIMDDSKKVYYALAPPCLIQIMI